MKTETAAGMTIIKHLKTAPARRLVDKAKQDVTVRIPVEVLNVKMESVESALFYVDYMPYKLVASMATDGVLLVGLLCDWETYSKVGAYFVAVTITTQPYVTDYIVRKTRKMLYGRDKRKFVFRIERDRGSALRTVILFDVRVEVYNRYLQLRPALLSYASNATEEDNSEDNTNRRVAFCVDVERRKLIDFGPLYTEHFYLDSKDWDVSFHEDGLFEAHICCRGGGSAWSCRADWTVTILDANSRNNVSRKFADLFSERNMYRDLVLMDWTRHPVFSQIEIITLLVEVVVKSRGPVPVQYL